MRYHQFFTNKLIFLIPFGVIFFANLIVTQIRGFEYAGQLAVFIASSSFLAIILGLRWDISLLATPAKKSGDNLVYGLISILLLSVLLICIFFIFSIVFDVFDEFLLLIFLSSISISISELLVNIFLKFQNSYLYILFRSLPYLFLVCFVTFEVSIEITWISSSFMSLFFLALVSVRYIKRLNFNISIFPKNIINQMLLKFVPTFSAVITNSIMLLWLVYIQKNFGDEITGIWINAYRIFSLPIALMGAAFLPVLLSKLSTYESFKHQIKKMIDFNMLLLPLVIFIILTIFTFGNELFHFLTNSTQLIDIKIMLYALFIGFLQYSLQYWKELFQSINRDLLFLFIILIQPFLAVSIYLFYIPTSIFVLLNMVLVISLISFVVLLFILFYLYFL